MSTRSCSDVDRERVSHAVVAVHRTALQRVTGNGLLPKAVQTCSHQPLLMKSNMDASQLERYRPVSNLPFLLKLLERAVHSQRQVFLDANSAMPAHQSANRKNLSIQTALVKVYDDLLKATDNGQMSALYF